MKLHLGCGGVYRDGYINIDLTDQDGKVDMLLDLALPLPEDKFADNSVEQIESYHMFEHLPFPCIEGALKSWYRVLEKGGKLIMEMPDFDETIKNVASDPNNLTYLHNVFGLQDRTGQFHRWGWNKFRLEWALKGAGFKDIQFPEPEDYHKNLEPCLRVEATK